MIVREASAADARGYIMLIKGILAEQPSVDGCIVIETGLLGRVAELDRPLDAWLGLVPFVLANGGLVGGYRVSPVSAGA